MTKYCDFCKSVFKEVIRNFGLFFHCEKCGNEVAALPEDTLMAEVDFSKISPFSSAREIINDPTNRIIDLNCPCGGKVGKMRSFGEDCMVIKVCETCEEQVID